NKLTLALAESFNRALIFGCQSAADRFFLAALRRNGRAGGAPARNRFGALLKGLLHCRACDCPMTPTHSTRNGRLRSTATPTRPRSSGQGPRWVVARPARPAVAGSGPTWCRRCVPVLVGVILPAKTDLTVLQGDQPRIGDSHAVRVAAEVAKYSLSVGKRTLGVSHPVLAVERVEPAAKGFRLDQCGQAAGQA